jgi:hypothetical protein
MMMHLSKTPEFLMEAGMVEAGMVEGDYFM